MPTERHGKVRRLLRTGMAVVVRLEPFTIRLIYESTTYKQPVTLGVKAGHRQASLCATSERKELFCAEVMLRDDVKQILESRSTLRRTRRSRKTRRRPARFNNRKRPEGWLTPTVTVKMNEQLAMADLANSILPISKTIMEVASFDTQKLVNPNIQGKEYQQGRQMGFDSVREYVLWRDGHKCQHCKGKSKDSILQVHHILHRSDGGTDNPDNLVTLCRTCHSNHHTKGMKLKVSPPKNDMKFPAYMNVTRWALYHKLCERYTNVHLTYGGTTKSNRIENGIRRDFCGNAFAIAGNFNAKRMQTFYKCRCFARHNRVLHDQLPTEHGKRKSKESPHWIGKTRLQRLDTVRWNGIRCFISGSSNGRPSIKDIDWKTVSPTATVNPSTLIFLSRKKGNIIFQNINQQQVITCET